MNISAIIMASGMSKRMNRDKLHLKLNNKYIYEYILETIKKCDFYEVLVVSKDDDILKKAELLEFKGIKNPKYMLGQSESIKAALINSKEDTDGFMFFVADQPLLKINTIEKLCDAFHNFPNSIIIPYYNGTQGNPVIFPSSLKSQLMEIEGDKGGKLVINNNQNIIVKINIKTDYENLDIDTIDDYNIFKDIFNE